MIEDPEIKSLFQAESEEHLDSLNKTLQLLQKEFSSSLVDQLFRSAHTIKGSSRMLGLEKIESIAHELEEILDSLRKNKQPPSSEEIGRMKEILSSLAGEIELVLKDKKEYSPTEEEEEVEPLKPSSSQTVRVQSGLVNNLISEASNLSASKNRCYRFIEMLDSAHAFVEEQRGFGATSLNEIDERIGKIRQEAYEEISKLDRLTSSLASNIQKLGRVPLAKLFDLFPDSIAEIAKASDKEVELIILGQEIAVDKRIIDEMKDPLMHSLRNAVVHGIETKEERERLGKRRKGTIELQAEQISDQLWIEINDDGRGLEIEKIRAKIKKMGLLSGDQTDLLTPQELMAYIFLPGFSTQERVTALAGRGVGMDVVKKQVELLGGSVSIDSIPNKGTRLTIQLPTAVMMTPILLIRHEKTLFGIPIEAIQRVELVNENLYRDESGRRAIKIKEQWFPLLSLNALLKKEGSHEESAAVEEGKPLLVLQIGHHQSVLIVDAILEEQQVTITPFHQLLAPFPWLGGAALLKTGQVTLILNPFYFMKRVETQVKALLLVDDSPALQAYYRDWLEKKGFRVYLANDGIDALEKLASIDVDAVISDLNMPRMNGMELLKKIRDQKLLEGRPFFMLTSLDSSEMKKEALKSGADGYFVKGGQAEEELLSLLNIHLND